MRLIDLFAGIGGIRLGFEKSFGKDSTTVFVSEWDNKCVATYKANFSEETIFAGDITQVSEKDIPSFDICLAGFPCQPFSMAGKHQGFDDDYRGMCRGTLFMDVARICEYHKPKVIFCENVKGLLTHDKKRTFQIIKKTFENIGYKVFYTVLNSKNFGVPQNRERLYIVCFRKDIAPETFVFPEGTDCKIAIKDILEPSPVPIKYFLSEQYLNTLKHHKERHSEKGNGFGYEVRDTDSIAGTIVCGGMGHERNLIKDSSIPSNEVPKKPINNEGIRKMTPREWARLQGFDDNFVFPNADTVVYKQLGNSVTVPVIEAIAKEIKNVLDNIGHKQMYLNEFHKRNSENCMSVQEQQQSIALSVEDVIEQGKKQGRNIQIIKK